MSSSDWFAVIVAVGFIGAAASVGAVYLWRWRKRQSLVRQRAKEDGGQFVEAQAALDRGDPLRAVNILRTPWKPVGGSLRECLVLTSAYSSIGADGLATDAFLAAAKLLKATDGEGNHPLRPSEAALVRQWLPRIPDDDMATQIRDLHPELELSASERRGGRKAGNAPVIELLDELATRIANDAHNAQADTRRWHTWNNLLGVLAAAAAAFAAVTAGFFEPTGLEKLIVVIPALVAAALSATLTTLKPSEQEQAAAVREGSLADLGQQMEMFQRLDLDAATGEELQRQVITEVYERAARANRRPVSMPLLDAGRARSTNQSERDKPTVRYQPPSQRPD
jgi:hypothetical protein